MVWKRSLSPGALVWEGLGPGALAQGPAWLQPWHSTWSPSGTKPWPTREVEHRAQEKQLWCQWRSSKDTYLPSPSPGGRLEVSSAIWRVGGPVPRPHPVPGPIPLPTLYPLCPLTLCPTCDGALAAAALGCKEFSKTGHTVGIVISGGELLPCQGRLAAGADQAFPMPGLVTVCHATLRQCLWGGVCQQGEWGFLPHDRALLTPPLCAVELGTPAPPAQPPPCCSGRSEEQTCSHSRARSSEHPCRAQRNGSPAAAHSCCTGSSAHATSGLRTPASGILWGTRVPLRG